MKEKSQRLNRHNIVFKACLAAVGVILLGYIVYNTWILDQIVGQSQHDDMIYDKAKNGFRNGSDNLTEYARRYVVTLDNGFRDKYIRESDVSANRDLAVSWVGNLPEKDQVVKHIRENFDEAMKISDDLMKREYYAMRLAAPDEESLDPSYPEVLKTVRLSDEDLKLDPSKRREKAASMLFDDEYAKAKQAIYRALDRNRANTIRRQSKLFVNQIAAVALFVLVFFLFFICSERTSSRRAAFLRRMLDTIPMLIYLKNRKTKCYVDCNSACADFFRRSGSGEIMGKTARELMDPELACELEANDEDALHRGKPTVYYEAVPGYPGQTRYLRTTRLGIRDAEGEPCLLGMSVDMTEEHERRLNSEATEEELMALQQEPMLATPVRILETVRNRLNADYCYVARCDEEKNVISIDPDSFVIRGGRTIPVRISSGVRDFSDLIDRVRVLGICTFSHEESSRIRRFFDIDRTAQDTPHAVTHAAVRLTVRGAFWGILAVAYSIARELNGPEKDFLQKSARIVESSTERALVYAALAKAQNDAICEGDISSGILDLMPIPCVVKDPGDDFRYIRCNQAYASLHHLTPAEMLGRRADDFYSDESLAVIRRTDAEAMAKREMIHFEDTCLWGDCNRRFFLYWKLPMTMQDGRTLLFCVAQDVTEVRQKINTEHFRNEITAFLLGHSEPEELLDFVAKRLIETLGCQHVLLHRHDGTRQDWFSDDEHTYCNKCVDCPLKTADPELFCHNGNVVLNDSNISDFPLPENCPTRILIARRILFEGDEWGKIGTLFTGDAFESLGFCEELLEQVANVISVCIERKARNTVIKRQNEEVLRINRQLHLARDRAVSAENARSYFFSCVSHDVRTPLNAIIGYAELLKKGIRNEKEQSAAYDAITMSGRSLLQLMNDMIDLARLESDTIVIKPALTDLADLAGKILHSFEIAVTGKRIRLRGEWDESMPYVEVDPKRMWQILFNLLDNAVKFTEEGEISLKLDFACGDSGAGALSIAVSDTGSGMSEAEQKRVMLPFASLSENGEHEIGAGLGLTICRHLVDRMNGTLELHSEPGRGTVFDIRIPDIRFSERTGSFPRPGSLIDFHGKSREALRVLIVDDVPLNISVLRAMLRKNGVSDIVCSVNGKDALARIRSDVPGFDLVLTDLWMPEMDGRKMLQELRTDSRFQSLNVIAITADVDAKDECMKLGFSDVIFKPVTLAKIINFLPPSSEPSGN